MKKYVLSILMAAVAVSAFGQIDSVAVQDLSAFAFEIAANANGSKNIIGGVPDVVSGGLLTLAIGLIIGFFRKRKKKKEGK